MFSVDPNTTLLIFCASLTLTYLAARLNVARFSTIFVYGTLVNSLMFYCYAIARGMNLVSALGVGALMGLIFTPMSIALALLFREASQKVERETETVVAMAHKQTRQ